MNFLAVAVDSDGSPVSVSRSGDSRRNIIMWMDHRAVKQAEKINASNSPVLQYCGGAVSPEMQPPKVIELFVGCLRVILEEKLSKIVVSDLQECLNCC